jgi:hypothetical protein
MMFWGNPENFLASGNHYWLSLSGIATGAQPMIRIQITNSGETKINQRGASGATTINHGSGVSLVEDQWNHWAGRMTSSETQQLIDGVAAVPDAHSAAFESGLDTLVINPKYLAVPGRIGEVQLHTTGRPDAWIEHEYDQTNSQNAFFGTWVNNPLSSGDNYNRTSSRKICRLRVVSRCR